MKKVGLFIDTVNLYNVLKFRYGKRSKLSYSKYVDFLADITNEFTSQVATCMSPNHNDNVELFYKALEDVGFTLIKEKLRHYQNYKDGFIGRKVDCDVALTVDLLNKCDNLDHIILGSNDDDLLPLVKTLKDKGKKVTIFACMIPDTLRDITDSYIEIPESLLENRDYEATATKR